MICSLQIAFFTFKSCNCCLQSFARVYSENSGFLVTGVFVEFFSF